MCKFDELLAKLDSLMTCEDCDDFKETTFTVPEEYRSKGIKGVYYQLMVTIRTCLNFIKGLWNQLRCPVTVYVRKEENCCYCEMLINNVTKRVSRFFHRWGSHDHRWCCKIKNLLKSLGITNLQCQHNDMHDSLCFTGEYVCM